MEISLNKTRYQDNPEVLPLPGPNLEYVPVAAQTLDTWLMRQPRPVVVAFGYAVPPDLGVDAQQWDDTTPLTVVRMWKTRIVRVMQPPYTQKRVRAFKAAIVSGTSGF